jgi:hypothetical protein
MGLCSFTRAKSYFEEIRSNDWGQRGSKALIEGLADLGAPASIVAIYLDTEVENILDWHRYDAQLPIVLWDRIIDLGLLMIRAAQEREEQREALDACMCPSCNRRRAGKKPPSLQNIFVDLITKDQCA